MSATPVIMAAPGLDIEAQLVGLLTRPGAPLTVSRRCVDALDLLAAAAEGSASVAVVSALLPRLTRDTISRLAAAEVTLIGLARAHDCDDATILSDLGVRTVTADPVDLDGTVAALVRCVVDPRPTASEYSGGGRARKRSLDAHDGHLVTVWGPVGAPGRTSVAVALADEWARLGTPALLVDADTVGGGAVATHLGVLDDVSGLVVACRQADTGRLDPDDLARAARTVEGRLRVLTGITRAERWAELRPPALVRLWSACRSIPGVTVVDAGSSLERDEEILTDARTPRRAAATLTALEAADTVVAVGRADPVGIERLIHGLDDLRRIVPDTPVRVVINRMRKSALGGDAEGQVREALHQHCGVTDVTAVPDDPGAFDACLREGRTLAEIAPRSAARGVLRALASAWPWPAHGSRAA